MSDGSDSVTEWVAQWKTGDQEAATKLWERYFDRLLVIARSRLRYFDKAAQDEEDLAIAVFASFLEGIRSGRIQPIKDRQHLWRLLEWIVNRRAIDQQRRQNAQRRTPISERALSNWTRHLRIPIETEIDQQANRSIPVALQAELDDELAFLKSKLPSDDLRRITDLRLMGYSNLEIAEQMKLSVSSVERKIRIVKETWLGEFLQ